MRFELMGIKNSKSPFGMRISVRACHPDRGNGAKNVDTCSIGPV
jgi:hypothetical protein